MEYWLVAHQSAHESVPWDSKQGRRRKRMGGECRVTPHLFRVIPPAERKGQKRERWPTLGWGWQQDKGDGAPGCLCEPDWAVKTWLTQRKRRRAVKSEAEASDLTSAGTCARGGCSYAWEASAGRSTVDPTNPPWWLSNKRAIFQSGSSRFKCLFYQQRNSPCFFFFIKFGTLALTSLLPTDMFAERSREVMRKKKK